MIIETVLIDDKLNPIEIQVWFDTHPDAVIKSITFKENFAYVIYS